MLRDAARDAMPPWVRDRVDENAAKWLIRRRSIEDLYRTVHDRSDAREGWSSSR